MTKNQKIRKSIAIPVIIILIISVVFLIPLIEPEVKILCISDPCFVPKQTIFEYISEHFGSI